MVSFLKKHPSFIFAAAIVAFLCAVIPELLNRTIFIDETLFIRTSYSQFFLKTAHPQWVAPSTFLNGLLLTWTESFKTTLLIGRAFNLALILLAVWFVPKKVTGSNWAPLIFLLVLSLHPTAFYFLSQARYDTSIFVLSFLFAAVLTRKKEFQWPSVLIGALLFVSSLKGLFYFIATLPALIFRVFKDSAQDRKQVAVFLAKFFLMLFMILGVFAAAGVLPQLIDTYADHWKLADAWTTDADTLVYNLKEHFSNGPLFYFLVLISIPIYFRHKIYNLYCKEFSIYAMTLFVMGWFYFFRHGRPYVFMTTAADLSGALLVTLVFLNTWSFLKKRILLWISLFVIVSIQLVNNPYLFFKFMKSNKDGFNFTYTADFPDQAKRLLPESHRVFDPSGLLYFAKPCHPEWYLDAPHSDQLRRGKWMTSLSLKNCSHVVQSVEIIYYTDQMIFDLGEHFEEFHYPLRKNRNFP